MIDQKWSSYFFFESEAEAIAAAHALEKLGGHAKKIAC